MKYYDADEIRRTIALMKPNNELFEVRIPGDKTLTGYFKDAETLLAELKKQDSNLQDKNIYITVNEPNDGCYARKQKDKLITIKQTTGDTDIYAYDWLMVDLDPCRTSGVSSTDEELGYAKDLGNKIFKYMKNLGFEKPLMAMSGNGVHLMYRINLANTEENKKLLENALKALDLMFSVKGVIEVDRKNFNPSRICKLYGTLAQKGLNEPSRPHRMSYIIGNPTEIKASDIKYLKKLCEIIPKEPERKRYNNYRPTEFDLDDWLSKYGIRYTKKSWSDADKYVLDECPFDSNHKAPDACILKFRNGAISFTCFHNSCSDHKWQDLRLMYEPDAYEKQRAYEERQMFQRHNRDTPPEPKKIIPKEGKAVFYTASEIIHRPNQSEELIKSGIEQYDRQFRGLRKNDVTILSGQTGSAKSTLLSQMILNAVDSENNVAVFSGELSDEDFMRWMTLQAAGKAYVQPTQYENYYNVPFSYQEKIATWLNDRFWLYNNDYGFDFNAIMDQFENMIDVHKLDLLCIDNLMALDLSDLAREKYEAQSQFAWRLHELAKNKHVHIIVVCHPRKPTGLLGMYDISGTSDIVNAADNIIFVYRRNQAFENAYAQYFGRRCELDGTNIWHCAKSRFGSVTDDYYSLYYEVETKRLKSELTENRIYGWNKEEADFHSPDEGIDLPFY